MADHSSPGNGESHPHDANGVDRRLWASVLLNSVIVAGEIAGGIAAGSVALLADALHNLSDVAALGLALAARRLGRRPASVRHTYGFRRAEVLAAALNAMVLLAVTAWIVREALARLADPHPVKQGLMLTVATIALLANGAAVLLLKRHAHDDLNVRSAFLHLLQDAVASLVVVLAALFAKTSLGTYLDPVASLVVALAVVRSAIGILLESLDYFVEAAPRGLDVEALATAVNAGFSPVSLHHIHVWEVGPGERFLTAHLSIPDMPVSDAEALLNRVKGFLAKEWAIGHATLEPEVCGCGGNGVLPECAGEAALVNGGRRERNGSPTATG